jgi:hypothetical protein
MKERMVAYTCGIKWGIAFSFMILVADYCHHGMARPQVADGGDHLQTWRVAANILNKQSRTADTG